MSGHKQIETIHKISEVLAEAFSKVKFITDEYLNAHQLEKNHLKDKLKEHKGQKELREEKPHPNKDKHVPEKDKSNNKEKSEEKPAESKKEQKKSKEAKKGHNPDKPKKPLTPFFRFQIEKINAVKEEYPSLTHGEAITVTSKLWGQMSPEERLPYQTSFHQQHEDYNRKIDSYYASHPQDRPKNYNKNHKNN